MPKYEITLSLINHDGERCGGILTQVEGDLLLANGDLLINQGNENEQMFARGAWRHVRRVPENE